MNEIYFGNPSAATEAWLQSAEIASLIASGKYPPEDDDLNIEIIEDEYGNTVIVPLNDDTSHEHEVEWSGQSIVIFR